MMFWLLVAAGCLLCWLSGYASGLWRARVRRERARGGYIRPPAPRERIENWCCPGVYDQARDVELLGWEAVAQAETQKVARP